MRARIAVPALCLATTFLACGSGPSLAAGAWTLSHGEYASEFRGGWFSSDIIHDADGGKRFLLGGGLVEERSLTSTTELGWKPRLSVLIGLPVKSSTRRFGAAADERILPTNTGLSDLLLGLKYRLARGTSAMALELNWKTPLGYERKPILTRADAAVGGDASGDGDSLDYIATRQLASPALGDGQQDLSLILHLGTAIPHGFAQASGGYKYRFEAPPDEIVMSADLGFWLTRSLLLAGRYQGEISLLSATEGAIPFLRAPEDDPTREVHRHLVGPELRYRVDDHLDLFAGTLHTASAKNALHTDEVFVGMVFKQSKLTRNQGFLGSSASP